MHTLNDTARFLQAIFPNYLTSAIFANLDPQFHTRDYTRLDATRGCYWSIAAFHPDAKTNLAKGALDVRALVIDDVGTKVSALAVEMTLGMPTAIVESSAENYQYVYRLPQPLPKEQFGALFDAAQAKTGETFDPATRDAVHLFRLPMGINTKPGRGGFAVRLVHLDPQRELTGIEPAAVVAGASDPVTGGAAEKYDRATLQGLMGLIPVNHEKLINDRKLWADVGHWIKALCDTPENGWEIFNEWSVGWEGNGTHVYTEEYTWEKWDSFGRNGGLQCTGGNLRALAEEIDREGFRTWDAKRVFDRGPNDPFPDRGARITATPYRWIELEDTEPRDWLYGDILLRKFISMTVAPGGVGKSSLVAVETLAQVTGRSLLGEEPTNKLRVWLWNLEDPYTETQLRIQAAAKHYNIREADIGDRLFVDSGRDQRLVVASMDRSGPVIVRPVVDAFVEQILLRGIDVVVIDPFVSCHEVPENDNTAQDMVVKEWGRVAELGRCAVHLVDHTSKAGSKDVVTDSSRGAKAKTDAARVVRVVNRMSDTDGKAYGIMETMRWKYFNTFNDKANMAPPKARRNWFCMESLWAGNGASAGEVFSVNAAAVHPQGDSVGVAVQWTPPSAQAMATGDSWLAVKAAMGKKRWRNEPRSPDWIGNAVYQGLQISAPSILDRTRVKELIKKWIDEGLLKVSPQLDGYRKPKEFIEIAGGY